MTADLIKAFTSHFVTHASHQVYSHNVYFVRGGGSSQKVEQLINIHDYLNKL